MEPIRPHFPEIYMTLALILAQRSSCHRLKVGAVIASSNYRQILGIGYNGNATGLPNQCDRDEAGNCGCLHAEENAVINCDCPRSTEKIVFVSHLPCIQCAKRLINLGNIKHIYYYGEYRLKNSLPLLAQAGIQITKMELTHPNFDEFAKLHTSLDPLA